MREKRRFWVALAVTFLVGVVALAVFNVATKPACGQSGCPPGYTSSYCDGAYAAGNCTCYAWRRASESAVWNNEFPKDLGHAHEWDGGVLEHYPQYSVGIVPYPNAIAVWEEYVKPVGKDWYVSRGGGHVAYVESTAGDSFTVSHMNYGDCSGCDLRHCVIGSTFNTGEFYGGDLHFIYPPSDRPVPLWPYLELRVAYGDPIVLRWYGNFHYYSVYETFKYADGGSGASAAWDIEEEYLTSGLPRSAKVTWKVCGYNSASDLEVCSGEQVFHAVLCPGGGTSEGESQNVLLDEDYCPPGSNPTPIPTSTPFLTPTPTPQPTNTPVPGPADLRQASDLTVSPACPMVNQEVTFNYAVKNYGGTSITIDTIMPQGHAYDGGQQTGLWNVPSHNITVSPGETVNITARRSFEWEATWCIEHIPVLGQNGVWFDLPADGHRQTQCFNVVSESPGELRQASDLQFSPGNPQVGEQVHFWFRVRNVGELPVSFLEMGPWGYGPNHTYWDANRHQGTGLVGGSSITINSYRTFSKAGTWTVDGIHYQLLDDSEPRGYYDLPSDGYTAAGMNIVVLGPTPTPTTEPTYTPGPTQTPVPTATEVPATATPLPTATPTPCTPLWSVGDFDCNCVIDVADIMRVASRWRCKVEDGCYDEIYDLDHDGDIDIVDIMLVVTHWGETCELPTPTLTPRPTSTPEATPPR